MLKRTAFKHSQSPIDHVWRIYASLVLYLVSSTAQAQAPIKARVYEAGTSNLLFHYERTESGTPANSLLRARFVLTDGTVYAEEELEAQNATHWHYRLRLPARAQHGSAKLEGTRLELRFTREGKEETDSDQLRAPLVIGPLLVDTILAQWDRLEKREPYPFRFLVLDRVETFGFKFVREDNISYQGRPAVRVLLKPTSVFVALAVKPIEFLFDPVSRKPLCIRGRTFLQKRKGNDWEDFLAETVFD